MNNPQFLPESAETLAILPIHEMVVFTKFYENWANIVDFSSIEYFGPCLIFYSPVSTFLQNPFVVSKVQSVFTKSFFFFIFLKHFFAPK